MKQEWRNYARIGAGRGVRHYIFSSTWFRIFVESSLDSKILGLIPMIPVYQIWTFVTWLIIYRGITKFYKNINESPDSDSGILPAFDVIRNQCRTPRSRRVFQSLKSWKPSNTLFLALDINKEDLRNFLSLFYSSRIEGSDSRTPCLKSLKSYPQLKSLSSASLGRQYLV